MSAEQLPAADEPRPSSEGAGRPALTASASGGDRFVLVVPADTCYLGAIRGFFQIALVRSCGRELDMLVLALDEACSNAMRHRSDDATAPGCVRIEARVRPGHVRFELHDFCCEGDVSKIKPRDLDDVRPGGLGTFFIGEIMDRVEFEVDEEHADRMILVMEKSWAVGGEAE